MGLPATSAEVVAPPTFEKTAIAELIPEVDACTSSDLVVDRIVDGSDAEGFIVECAPEPAADSDADAGSQQLVQEEEASVSHDDADSGAQEPPRTVDGPRLPLAVALAAKVARQAENRAALAEPTAATTPPVEGAAPEGAGRMGPPPRREGYMRAAARDFRQPFAHRLRWEHAVNSWSRLRLALQSDANLLEADVSTGPLLAIPGYEDSGQTSVVTSQGGAVIMAHYPTERKSDLSLERFVQTVLQHNQTMAVEAEESSAAESSSKRRSAGETPGAQAADCRLPFRRREDCSEDVSSADEAAAFRRELDKELDRMASQSVIPSCAGSRKSSGSGASSSSGRTLGGRKGIKLDFKQFSCVEPTLQYLRKVGAVRRLGGHLWLNADVFAGPGALVTPLDAQKFVRHCAEYVPEAVLSLGWGATVLSTTRQYTHEMIYRMIELCMCPIVKHTLPCSRSPPSAAMDVDTTFGESEGGSTGSSALPSASDDGEYVVAPAMACRHITFAVAAEYAMASVENLNSLLELMPTASLTIYTGVGSLGVTPATVEGLINAFGKSRCFFDLHVTRPWRSWFWGSSSSAAEARNSEARSFLSGSSCGPPAEAGGRWSSSRAPSTTSGAPRSYEVAIV